MRRARSLPLVLLGSMVFMTAAWAQQAESVQELYRQLRSGGDGADQAAFELFRRGDQDAQLRRILAGPNSKTGWRLSVLRALKYGALALGDESRPRAACVLAYEALDDPVPEVAEAARATFGSIEVPGTYAFIGERLEELRWVALSKSDGKRALSLVSALEAMRNPQRSTEVLAKVLDGRLGPELEIRVREALERLTSLQFASPKQWVGWTQRVSGLTPHQWKQRVKKAQEDKFRRYERECEDIFKSLLAALRGSPDRLLEELEKGLKQVTNPAVRKRAVLELGRMGRLNHEAVDPKSLTPKQVERRSAQEAQRKRAVALLKSQLPARGDTSASYDSIKTLVILHLGKTGDPSLREDIARFLSVTSPRMRVAAALALGELGDPKATLPLVAQLEHSWEVNPERPARELESDPELVQALIQALGRIRHNTVEGEDKTVSRVLTDFCRKLLKVDAKANPYVALHLTRSAEALGKLDYANLQQLDESVPLLIDLATHADPKVRFAAVTALGPLPHPGAFPLLERRMTEETEDYIRKAILDGIGAQGVALKNRATAALDLLVPFLFRTNEDDGLRRRSFDAIKRIVRGDSTFGALKHLAEALQKNREHSAALQALLPFLRQLPTPGTLDETMKANLATYHELIGLRALAFLPKDPEKALSDFNEAIGKRRIDASTLPLFLGKGRAKLLQGATNEAFDLARGCLKSLGASELPELRHAVWSLALDALDAIRVKRPTVADGFMRQLEPHVASLPATLKERFEGLKASK